MNYDGKFFPHVKMQKKFGQIHYCGKRSPLAQKEGIKSAEKN
jgi:hypothetical protein